MRVRPGCQPAHAIACPRKGRTHLRRLSPICLGLCLAFLALVSPAAGATAPSPDVAFAPPSFDSLALRDDSCSGVKLGPAIYAAPLDEEEELEGGDEDEEFCPGPDPCLATHTRLASLSPLAVRCPGQSCTAARPSPLASTAALVTAHGATACPALETSVQFLC